MRDFGGKDRKKLEEADIAIHIVYERVGSLAATKKKIVDGYAKGFCHMLSTKQELPFGGSAPQVVVVDLETMKVLGRNPYDPPAAIRMCENG